MRADGVQLGGEDAVGAEQRLQGEGGGDVGRGVEPVEVGQGHDQHAEHAVGAVEQREPLLLAQLDRGDAVLGQQLGRGPHGAVGALGVPLAHQGQRAVAERRQVAGAAQRAVLVHHRGDPRVQHVGDGLRHLGADAGVAGAERLQPQEHQRPHHLALHPRAHPRRVRAHDVALELGAQLRADVPGGEGAEPGGDPVDRFGLGGQRVDRLPGVGERGQGFRGECDAGSVTGDRDDVGRAGAGGSHHHSVHIHIQERTQ